jgi:cell wall-associated NlpC family hydrolase
LIKAALVAAAALGLAACATTSRETLQPPQMAAASNLSAEQSPPVSHEGGAFVDAALAMLGQPYRYGGAAPGGFDCSGLVFYAATSAGIRVPRTAADQLRFGTAVTRKNLQAGDLIFMHLSGKELHVAIALGSQLFIHAPSSGGRVRIDSLIAPPYESSFVGARRLLPTSSSTVSFPTPN